MTNEDRKCVAAGAIVFVLGATALLLIGCATPSSGGEAGGISIINSPHASITITGDGNGTATAAPESEGTSASAAFSPEVTVPVR